MTEEKYKYTVSNTLVKLLTKREYRGFLKGSIVIYQSSLSTGMKPEDVYNTLRQIEFLEEQLEALDEREITEEVN